jgi:hypothetical protein
MANLTAHAAAFKTGTTATSTGSNHAGWRAWWQAEASRQCSDWPSIITAHLTIVDQLRDADDADARIGCSS